MNGIYNYRVWKFQKQKCNYVVKVVGLSIGFWKNKFFVYLSYDIRIYCDWYFFLSGSRREDKKSEEAMWGMFLLHRFQSCKLMQIQ